jgi:hypothetical protein
VELRNAERLVVDVSRFGKTLDVRQLGLVFVFIDFVIDPFGDDIVKGVVSFVVCFDDRFSKIIGFTCRVLENLAKLVDLIDVLVDIETIFRTDVFELDDRRDEEFDVFK